MESKKFDINNENYQVLNTVSIEGKNYILCNNINAENYLYSYDIYKLIDGEKFEIDDINELRVVYEAFLNSMQDLNSELKYQLLQDFEYSINQ